MTTIRTTRRDVITRLSSAKFTVRNLGASLVTGTVPITSGWVESDESGTPLSVHADLDLGAMDTGIARRDSDLRKPSLLDLDRYPSLAFTGRLEPAGGQSTAAREEGLREWSVPGAIEAHGASVPITLTATSAVGPDGSTTVQASGDFDRRDLDIRAPRFMIGRRIRVRVEVVFAPALP